jgi:beta-alanine degradation protein BauB
MLCRLFWAAVVACLVVNSATAQDPTKVEPKHYKLRFENDRVQVVDVHYGPHEKSEMHEHPSGVSVSVTGGHLRFIDQNGKVTEVYAKAGEARWFPPHKHRVENLGDESYNGVYIGIKGTSGKVSSDPNQRFPASAEQIGKILVERAQPTAQPRFLNSSGPLNY